MPKGQSAKPNCKRCSEEPNPYIPQDTLSSLYKEYYKESPETYSDKLLEITNDGLKRFIESEAPWNHLFDDEAREYSRSEDCEASVLSKLLFFNLFSIMRDFALDRESIVLNKRFDFETHCSGGEAKYGQFLPGGEGQQGEILSFHFDIMSNPNCARSSYRIGTMAKDNGAVPLSFRDVYHTIGNFAPLPWWIPNPPGFKAKYENLQAIHNGFAEWWDVLLLYLQQNMPKHSMSFRDYLILTCQFFYVDMDLCEKRTKEEEDACQRLRKLQTGKGWASEIDSGKFDWNTVDWEDLVSNLSSILGRMDDVDIPILSLMDAVPDSEKASYQGGFPRRWDAGFVRGPDFFLSSTKAVKKEKENKLARNDIWRTTWSSHRWHKDAGTEEVKETDQLIRRLIEARGRCIIGLLRGCKTLPSMKA